jgi:hypothetical protein
VMPCCLVEVYWCFRGMYYPLSSGPQSKPCCLLPASTAYSSDIKMGGIFLQNISKLPDNMASCPQRWYSFWKKGTSNNMRFVNDIPWKHLYSSCYRIALFYFCHWTHCGVMYLLVFNL